MFVDTEMNKRGAKREAVMKAAKMVFGSSVIDCVVQNLSTSGARIRTASVVPIPERVKLHLRDGPSYHALRMWTRGAQIGLQFVDGSSPAEYGRLGARAIHQALHTRSLDETIRLLREARFFGDPKLSQLADQLQAGQARLEAALLAMILPTTEPPSATGPAAQNTDRAPL